MKYKSNKAKTKTKKPECVCGESSPHSKYNETIHYFPLKSFPIFQLALLLSLFLLLFHVCILNICQRHPMTSYSHCRAEWNTLRHTSPWKILERREEERKRDLRSSRLGCHCVQQKDEKQLTSPEWKKKDHLDSVAKCYPVCPGHLRIVSQSSKLKSFLWLSRRSWPLSSPKAFWF